MAAGKKICFILPHFHLEYSGGAEIQCYYLAQELLERGWEVHYIRESKDPETHLMEGIRVHAIPPRKSYLKWKNAAVLAAKMADIRADVWYNRATLAYLPAIVRQARHVGGKVVFAFSRDSQFSYREFRGTYEKPHMQAYANAEQYLFFRALRKTDRILVQTRMQQARLRDMLHLPGEHIYNAHPLDTDSLTSLGREQVILWIARIKHFKRPERFVELARHFRGQPYQFKLIGKLTGDDLSRSLVDAAADLPNLELLGEQSSEQVHNWLRRARLLVNSSDVEGFSNTFIEAWLRGVPVMSMQVDPDDMIRDFGLGVLQPDFGRFCAEVETFMTDAAYWAETSQRCSDFAQANFDIRQAVSKLEAAL
ncbi:MAG: hypothetical protein OHK0039_32710 [Bacteroidia bacterium]